MLVRVEGSVSSKKIRVSFFHFEQIQTYNYHWHPPSYSWSLRLEASVKVITITKNYKNYFTNSESRLSQFDHLSQMITLSVITYI